MLQILETIKMVKTHTVKNRSAYIKHNLQTGFRLKSVSFTRCRSRFSTPKITKSPTFPVAHTRTTKISWTTRNLCRTNHLSLFLSAAALLPLPLYTIRSGIDAFIMLLIIITFERVLKTINIVIWICGNKHLTHATTTQTWHWCGTHEQKERLRAHSKQF